LREFTRLTVVGLSWVVPNEAALREPLGELRVMAAVDDPSMGPIEISS